MPSAVGKRYYWIKLREDFLDGDAVDYLMGQRNGAGYVVLYLMLCMRTANTDGRLSTRIGEIIIPFDIDKIVRDCKYFTQDTVRVALELYCNLGLVYKDVDGTLVIANHTAMVGSETDYAVKKAKQRQLSAFSGGILARGDNVPPDVPQMSPKKSPQRKSKSIEKDTEIKSNFSGGGDTRAGAREDIESLVENFVLENGLAMPDCRNAAESVKDAEILTKQLFARFASRAPTKNDETYVYNCVTVRDRIGPGDFAYRFDRDRAGLLTYAFEKASRSGKAADWNYIDGILGHLKERKIYTLNAAMDYDDVRAGAHA